MTLNELQKKGEVIFHFERKGFLLRGTKMFCNYRRNNPTYATLFLYQQRYYLAKRIQNLNIINFDDDYDGAVDFLRDFIHVQLHEK